MKSNEGNTLSNTVIIANSPVKPNPCNWDTSNWAMLGLAPGETSSLLNLSDTRELINASAFASHQAMPHLVHVTMRLDMARSFEPRDWMEWQGRLLDKMSRWLRRNDTKVSFLWVREMGRINGPHLHLLLHLPVELWAPFKQFMLTTGDFDPTPNVTGEAIKLEGGAFGTKSHRMRAGCLRYLLKSIDPHLTARSPAADGGTGRLADLLGIRTDADRIGIAGKRCGVSYSIGATMRQAFGWRELQTVPQMRTYLHP